MSEGISGIHHVTAICRDAQKNLDFYTDVLGLRLIKRTVNFDDPTSYHLYYGDTTGHPGTLLTFFAYPDGAEGRLGSGMATSVTLATPPFSLNFWRDRLRSRGIETRDGQRFEAAVLCFEDPDGMQVELVESDLHETKPWEGNGVGKEHAITGIDGVQLVIEGYEGTAKLLHDRMGYRTGPHEDNRFRYVKPMHHIGGWIDLVCQPDAPRGRVAIGSIHHVAFRVDSDQKQRLYRIGFVDDHLNVSPVLDRQYFHSLYFREPGGVLIEIATDGPGFTVDEPLEELGGRLCLPTHYEGMRDEIEEHLPPLEVKSPAASG